MRMARSKPSSTDRRAVVEIEVELDARMQVLKFRGARREMPVEKGIGALTRNRPRGSTCSSVASASLRQSRQHVADALVVVLPPIGQAETSSSCDQETYAERVLEF